MIREDISLCTKEHDEDFFIAHNYTNASFFHDTIVILYDTELAHTGHHIGITLTNDNYHIVDDDIGV